MAVGMTVIGTLGPGPLRNSVARFMRWVRDSLCQVDKGPWRRCVASRTACRPAGPHPGSGDLGPDSRAADNCVHERVRHLLARHKVSSRGTRRFPGGAVVAELGVLRLRRVHPGPPWCALR